MTDLLSAKIVVEEPCNWCEGSGNVWFPTPPPLGELTAAELCGPCQGTGLAYYSHLPWVADEPVNMDRLRGLLHVPA